MITLPHTTTTGPIKFSIHEDGKEVGQIEATNFVEAATRLGGTAVTSIEATCVVTAPGKTFSLSCKFTSDDRPRGDEPNNDNNITGVSS